MDVPVVITCAAADDVSGGAKSESNSGGGTAVDDVSGTNSGPKSGSAEVNGGSVE